ncbi:MAG TPA: pyridoxamine 5'-phosphate oxidase family protein [Acidimicrobiales bacterium]|nr:pyridoxamine 5'-phosphate oxidase family protein [Acidimicrobiales bacterium]HMS87731.1 pyridoxamine 5'-phosphate oxidase family protein [Acidimicrobiales bacterium]HRA35184.1 pyridoxamine 5'-phosphate oxidase family protein [Acidimicrobiales bacterium]
MSALLVIDETECLHLLHGSHLGRLGFTARSLPVVLPVNYVVDGTRVVFTTDSASILAAAIASDVACLEVDDHDDFSHTGWSVLVTGHLSELIDGEADEVTHRVPLPSWRPMPYPHVLGLDIEMLSGRRLAP